MALNHQTVLVTGAGGFIGSHLTERLVQAGARTRALVRYNSRNSWGWLDRSPVKEDLEIVLGDVRDPESLREAFRGVDIVFHLAALIGIPYSYHAPRSYVQTNVEGTLNVLHAALAAEVRLLIHTSTSEVYGSAQYVPMDEQHPLQGQSPYAASKIGADKMVEAFHRSFGLPATIIRPFNTFGPRQSARAVIPTVITQCLAGGPVRLGNLYPTRDLSFVADVVEGYLSAAQTPSAIGSTLNLGTGREVGIDALVRLIGNLVGSRVEIEQADDRIRPPQSEVTRLLADASRARQVLGWEPRVSLEDGLRATVEWMREQRDEYRAGVYAV